MGRQKQAIVLLINDSGLHLFSWTGAALTWKRAFHATPAELEEFDAALDEFQNCPAIIVTDLIEESFRHDTVVHVTGSDRAAVLKRKLDFVFRSTTYRLARVIERETTGRRDDRIMMSAITKPDIVEIWVRVLLAKRIAIQSVTSVAHLLQDFCVLSKLDKEEFLLLINVEHSGNLRQTFVRKGVVMFSRLTPMQQREDIQLGSDVLQETAQLRQYFERIQFVPYEAALRIQVYSVFDDVYLQLEARSTELNRFEVMDVDSLLAPLPVQLGETEPSPVHYFLAVVLAGSQPANIYAPPSATKYQDLRNFARALWITTGLITGTGLGLCALPALSILDQWQQRDALLAQAAPLEAEYQALTARFPETPLPPQEMQLVVETHDVIKRQVRSPVDVLNMISTALAPEEGLELTAISWEVVEKSLAEEAVENSDGSGSSEPPLPDTASITGLVLAERTQIRVRIDGEAFSPASFRAAQEQVNALIDALAQNPGVSVFASKMPTEVRTDIEVSTTVDDREVRGPFTLELTLTEPEPQDLAAEENADDFE